MHLSNVAFVSYQLLHVHSMDHLPLLTVCIVHLVAHLSAAGLAC